MRELVRRTNVTGGVDAPIARPQKIVHAHAVRIVFDTGLLQSKPFDIRPATDCDEDGIRFQSHRIARFLNDQMRWLAAAYLRYEMQMNLLTLELLPNDRDCLRFLFAKQTGRTIDEMNLTAEASKGLAQFTADRTSPHYDKTPRQLRQSKDCLVRETAEMIESGQFQRGRACSGGNHRPREPQRLTAHVHRISSGEPRFAQKHIDA